MLWAVVAIAAVAIAVLARPCQKGWEVVATVHAGTGEGKCQAAGMLGEHPADISVVSRPHPTRKNPAAMQP